MIVVWLAAIALVAALIYLASLDGRFDVQRSITIDAAAASVFDAVRDFKRWPEWSPWLIHEPATRLEFGPQTDEPGGWYSWDGQRIGAGRITHTAMDSPRSIEQRIEFTRPFKALNDVCWTFADEAGGTRVTWSMRGRMPFLFRFLVGRMSAMVGKDFELGLAMLRGRIDPSSEHPVLEFRGVVERAPQTCLAERFSGHFDDLKSAMERAYPALIDTATASGEPLLGPPLAIYHRVDPERRTTDCAIAVPIADATPRGGFVATECPGGRYFAVSLRGSYAFLELAWPAALSDVRMRKLKHDRSRPFLEIYENDPRQVAGSNDYLTSLLVPIR